jgi:hypothetical protein
VAFAKGAGFAKQADYFLMRWDEMHVSMGSFPRQYAGDGA